MSQSSGSGESGIFFLNYSNYTLLGIISFGLGLHLFSVISFFGFLPIILCFLIIHQSNEQKGNLQTMIISFIPYFYLFLILLSKPNGSDFLFLSVLVLLWLSHIDSVTHYDFPILFFSATISFSSLLSVVYSGAKFAPIFCFLISSLTYIKHPKQERFHLSHQFSFALFLGTFLSLFWIQTEPTNILSPRTAELSLSTNLASVFLGWGIFRFLHQIIVSTNAKQNLS